MMNEYMFHAVGTPHRGVDEHSSHLRTSRRKSRFVAKKTATSDDVYPTFCKDA